MKLESYRNPEPVKVISPTLLISCFGICLGSAYQLIPKGAVPATGHFPIELRDPVAAQRVGLRQSDTFNRLRREFEQAGSDTEQLSALLPTMLEAALQADRGAEMLPSYEAYFAMLEVGKLSLGELAERGAESRAFIAHAKSYAQICEWNDFFDNSFDFYLKGAALGDGFSLERAIELNRGLVRNTDLAELLSVVVPVHGHPEYSLMLARLLGQEARYSEARASYLRYLESHPQEAQARLELAALEDESGDLRSSLAHYKTAGELRPDDVDLQMRMAELHIALGEHDEAFALYRHLPDDSHTVATREHLVILAEAVGDYHELDRATGMRFAALEKPWTHDYLALAHSHSLSGNAAGELSVLERATRAHPESPQVALAYADALYREGRPKEAINLLMRRDLSHNIEAMSLFIELCSGLDEHRFAARNLPPNIEGRFVFAPSIRIQLGQIYEEAGDVARAQRLYDSVPDGRREIAKAKAEFIKHEGSQEYLRPSN